MNFYACVTTEEGKSLVLNNLASTRFGAKAEAESVCKVNNYTLNGVYQYKNQQKQPGILSKGNIESNKGKKGFF